MTAIPVDNLAGTYHVVAGSGDLLDKNRVGPEHLPDPSGVDQINRELLVVFGQGALLELQFDDSRQTVSTERQGNREQSGHPPKTDFQNPSTQPNIGVRQFFQQIAGGR